MRNAGLDEAQTGIKTVRRSINNLRHANDTTLMAESKEEVRSFLMKVKEGSEKAGLKFNIQKTNTMASKSHHLMVNRWGKMETVETPKSLQMVTTAIKLKDASSLEEKL